LGNSKLIIMKKLFTLLLIACSFETVIAQTQVKFHTTLGDFIVELNDTLAPITAGNFKNLVQDKYYDGVTFHRVINNFMIQGGNGATKPNIQDEFHVGLSNTTGTISMANTGAVNSGNTQFFINLINNTRLDYNKAPLSSKHPVFGKVVENFSVVQAIGSAPVNGSVPSPAIYMDSLRLYASPGDTTNNGGGVSVYDFNAPTSSVIEVFPNPLTSKSFIKVKAHSNTINVRLIDLLGNELVKKELETTDKELLIQLYSLTAETLPSGIYFLEAQSVNVKSTIRLVVP